MKMIFNKKVLNYLKSKVNDENCVIRESIDQETYEKYIPLIKLQNEFVRGNELYANILSFKDLGKQILIRVNNVIGNFEDHNDYLVLNSNEEIVTNSFFIDKFEKIGFHDYKIIFNKQLTEENILYKQVDNYTFLSSNHNSFFDLRKIRAQYTKNSLFIYQAFNQGIARYAVAKNKFGDGFRCNRMTWIKPSFLWMMYRSGWASKRYQQRILKIEIKKDIFIEFLKDAALTSELNSVFKDLHKQEHFLKEKANRVQWDKDRDIYNNPLDRRAIQIGIASKNLNKYFDGIIHIDDITDKVIDLREKMKEGTDISSEIPIEYPMPVNYWDHFLVNIY